MRWPEDEGGWDRDPASSTHTPQPLSPHSVRSWRGTVLAGMRMQVEGGLGRSHSPGLCLLPSGPRGRGLPPPHRPVTSCPSLWGWHPATHQGGADGPAWLGRGSSKGMWAPRCLSCSQQLPQGKSPENGQSMNSDCGAGSGGPQVVPLFGASGCRAGRERHGYPSEKGYDMGSQAVLEPANSLFQPPLSRHSPGVPSPGDSSFLLLLQGVTFTLSSA